METSRFFNWVKEYGWRHFIALIFVTFAVYPILFVATNSVADFEQSFSLVTSTL